MVTYQFTTYPLANGSNDKRVRVKRRNAPQTNKMILITKFIEWILNMINTYIPYRYESVTTGVNIMDKVLKRIPDEIKGANKFIENNVEWILERIGSVPSDPDQLNNLKDLLVKLLIDSIVPFCNTFSNVNHINDPDSRLRTFLDNELKKDMGYSFTILMTPYKWEIFFEASKDNWQFLLDTMRFSKFNTIIVKDVINTKVLPGINNVPDLLLMLPNIQEENHLTALYYSTLYDILASPDFSIKELLSYMIAKIRIKVREKYNMVEDVENRLIAAYYDYCVRGENKVRSVAFMSRTPQQTIKAITNMVGKAQVKKYSTIKLINDTDYLEKIFAYLLYCKEVKRTLNNPPNRPHSNRIQNRIQRLKQIYTPFDGKDNALNDIVQRIETNPDMALEIIRMGPLKGLIEKDTTSLTQDDGEQILIHFINGFKRKNNEKAKVKKGGGTRRKRANRRKTRRTT
jgi:hypothetical protein